MIAAHDGGPDPLSPYLRATDGTRLWLQSPYRTPISVERIARTLSKLCRFGGHLPGDSFYSVASHSVEVSMMLPPELAAAGLLHDATEWALGDVPSPLKSLLPGYRDLEALWRARLEDHFGFLLEGPEIKAADTRALAIERECLLAAPGYEPTRLDGPAVTFKLHERVASERPCEAFDRFMRRAQWLELVP